MSSLLFHWDKDAGLTDYVTLPRHAWHLALANQVHNEEHTRTTTPFQRKKDGWIHPKIIMLNFQIYNNFWFSDLRLQIRAKLSSPSSSSSTYSSTSSYSVLKKKSNSDLSATYSFDFLTFIILQTYYIIITILNQPPQNQPPQRVSKPPNFSSNYWFEVFKKSWYGINIVVVVPLNLTQWLL